MAWLNATPKPAEGTKRAAAKNQPPPKSRNEQMKAIGVTPKMPTVSAPHILARLVEIGLTEAAGMGSAPLSWQSINAWQQSVRLRLAPWEARLIRKLSVEYLAEGRRAESENCPAPWHSAPTEQDREIELRALQSVLG